MNVIGLIPAAGRGTRIGPLPGSKELYPIGFQRRIGDGALHPKPVCLYLLEAMRKAGIRRAYLVLRAGKWDIPDYLRDGHAVGMDLAYLMMHHPYGAPFTLDQAYPFVRDAVVALGLPDILFEPADAYARLLAHQRSTEADLVLGLFPVDAPDTADMVALAPDGRVRLIDIKPAHTSLRLSWALAVWTPTFTTFLHQTVAEALRSDPLIDERERFIGHVFQDAIEAGLHVAGLQLSDQPFLDIGTPDNLLKALHRFATPPA